MVIKKSLIGMGIVGASLAGFFGLSNMDKPKEPSIVQKILSAENNSFPDLQTLDYLVKNSKDYIERKNSYSRKEIGEISQKIYGNILEKFPNIKKERDWIDLCYRTSLINLEIFNANGIPVYAVEVPGHIFLRYDTDGKHDPLNPNDPINKGDINIETTTGEIENGKNYSDKEYIQRKAISKNALEKGLSLKNMDREELLALSYWMGAHDDFTKGIHASSKKLNERAIEKCNKAISLNPDCAQAYHILGMANANKGGIEFGENYEKAITSLNRALELEESPKRYTIIAGLCSYSGQNKKAIENYTNSINLIHKTREEFNKPTDYLRDLEVRSLTGRKDIYERLGDEKNVKIDSEKIYSLSFR